MPIFSNPTAVRDMALLSWAAYGNGNPTKSNQSASDNIRRVMTS